jgi:long-subunit fatty acid transport protein
LAAPDLEAVVFVASVFAESLLVAAGFEAAALGAAALGAADFGAAALGVAAFGAAALGAAALGAALSAAGGVAGASAAAHASDVTAARPTTSARLVASAVDRNVPARAERITKVLCGPESSGRSGQGFLTWVSYLIENVDKILRSLPVRLFAPAPRQNRGWNRLGIGTVRPFRLSARPDMNCLSWRFASTSAGRTDAKRANKNGPST